MADQKLMEESARDEVEVGLGPSPEQTKVELDLDDAPFLRLEEPESEELPAEVEEPEEEEDEGKKKKRRKLLLIAAAAGAGLLLIAGLLLWWFVFRTPPPPPPTGPEPEVIVVPSVAKQQGPQEFVKKFDPFLVPHADANGATRFLVCEFSALSTNALVNSELEQQMRPLRDAMYFYLRSKD
ncbi:MAG: flagellar basal body protein FliL, partial [Desulfovibrionaceae bacterium]|nr:flagellar basal body protein FliL [Desulfovibrionaceae bacterium]